MPAWDGLLVSNALSRHGTAYLLPTLTGYIGFSRHAPGQGCEEEHCSSFLEKTKPLGQPLGLTLPTSCQGRGRKGISHLHHKASTLTCWSFRSFARAPVVLVNSCSTYGASFCGCITSVSHKIAHLVSMLKALSASLVCLAAPSMRRLWVLKRAAAQRIKTHSLAANYLLLASTTATILCLVSRAPTYLHVDMMQTTFRMISCTQWMWHS